MEEVDKGCPMIRMVCVREFLLVLAYPGRPGSTAVKRLRVCMYYILSSRVIILTKINHNLRFAILMTDTWHVKRCIIIITLPFAKLEINSKPV